MEITVRTVLRGHEMKYAKKSTQKNAQESV